VDRRIEDGFLPHMYEEGNGKQVSLSEILQARRHGKISSNSDDNNSQDLNKQLPGKTWRSNELA